MDYLNFSDEGEAQPRVDLTWVTRDKAAALVEITETIGASDARTIKIKLHDKMPALVRLGQHLGMWSARRDNLPKRLDQMNEAEVCALLGTDLPVDQADDQLSDGLFDAASGRCGGGSARDRRVQSTKPLSLAE